MEVQLRRLGVNSKIKVLKVPKECNTKIWLAGRGTSCHIYTKSKYASRQHFAITYREQKYFISDLNSANGTFLNDEKVISERLLTLGSIISVGVPSNMQNSADCIVYVFETCSGVFFKEKPSCILSDDETPTFLELKQHSCSEPVLGLADLNMDVGAHLKQTNQELINKSLDTDKGNDNKLQTDLSDSSSNDVIIVELSTRAEEHSDSSPKPAKIRKLEESREKTDFNDPQYKTKTKKIELENEDILAYEALTQVDDPPVKIESELLNYSVTEELIEISDSEDDWSPVVMQEDCKFPDGIDEDDEVIVLETVINLEEHRKNDLSLNCKTDDLTEVDWKWVGRLLKVKKEDDIFKGNEEVPKETQNDKTEEATEETKAIMHNLETVGRKTESAIGTELNIVPCTVRLSKLSTYDISTVGTKSIRNVEDLQKNVPRKSVSFDLVPQIKYYYAPLTPKLTASDKGRMRFTRIIYNICNWNSHWLEECKRVAPDKDPLDICDEPLRKIPKKFFSHSDYITSFIPVMLLQLWNKVKKKWVDSGGFGFKQTVSCDSCEDYNENLSVYKCTGLVQSVEAHEQLIREGHLILLRLHQVQNPQFATPASEKYSKKLGYLVFGLVERKIYKRFHNEPLHQVLAERCASVMGDLHVVKLNILVKKRPNFQIDKKKLMQLTVVHKISQEIRMFKGICFLPDSPLCSAILRPSENKVSLPELPQKDLIFKGPLDDVQRDIVKKLSHACCFKNSFLYSIHGAAGTGKGQLLMALIFQLLYADEWKCKRPKIIYCTQWNTPLDEMVVRLKNYRQAFELDEPFNLVRIGPTKEVKPEVRDLCLSNLASNFRNFDKTRFNGGNYDAEVEVIKGADIICTTCTLTGMSKMCLAFKKLSTKDRNRKVVCIIDEAMSCKEIDSVIPLLLGVTHLILAGDIYQLEPDFSGEKTHSLGLDMSLFWRIYKNFVNISKELSPIYVLKTQYRMNSSISDFLCQLIYNVPMQKPAISVPSRIGTIKSHFLFLGQTSENTAIIEKKNQENEIVFHLIKAVTKLIKEVNQNVVSCAVILCDEKQVEILQSLFPKREFPELEINKIQTFQGREFDVVIFIYDGKKIRTSWLTTALTRAKCSLFIFASRHSINGSSFFKRMADNAEKNGFLKHVDADTTVKDFEEILKIF